MATAIIALLSFLLGGGANCGGVEQGQRLTYSRLALAVHHLLDVLADLVLGPIWVLLSFQLPLQKLPGPWR